MRCWKRKRKDRLLDLGALWGRLPSWVQPQPQAPGCMRTPSWSKGQSGLQRGGGTRLFRWVLPAGSELTDSPGPGGCRNRAAVAPLRTFTLLSLPPVHERQMLAIADWERKETVWFGAPAETSWGAPGSRGSGQPSWSSSVIVPILPPGKAARVPAPTQQVHQGGCWDPAG